MIALINYNIDIHPLCDNVTHYKLYKTLHKQQNNKKIHNKKIKFLEHLGTFAIILVTCLIVHYAERVVVSVCVGGEGGIGEEMQLLGGEICFFRRNYNVFCAYCHPLF